jgi:hypothetical protein
LISYFSVCYMGACGTERVLSSALLGDVLWCPAGGASSIGGDKASTQTA